MSEQDQTVMRIYRMVGERRIPYRFVLDSNMTVLHDQPDLDALRAETMAAHTASLATLQAQSVAMYGAEGPAQQARQAAAEAIIDKAVQEGKIVATTNPMILAKYPHLALDKVVDAPKIDPAGIVSEETLPNGGKKIVYRPTATDLEVGKWVTKLVVENPIPGTDELRAEYFAEEQAMKDKAAADGKVCKKCELGALIRKYRAKLEAQGFLK